MEKLIKRIINSCSNIVCNCVPYEIRNNKAIHLPEKIKIKEWGENNTLFLKKCKELGLIIDSGPPYDIIVILNNKIINLKQISENMEEHGKLYVVLPSEKRKHYLDMFSF